MEGRDSGDNPAVPREYKCDVTLSTQTPVTSYTSCTMGLGTGLKQVTLQPVAMFSVTWTDRGLTSEAEKEKRLACFK